MEKAWKNPLVEKGVLVEFCHLSRLSLELHTQALGQASSHTNLRSYSETILC